MTDHARTSAELLAAHMAAERASDYRTAAATASPEIVYEFPFQGVCFRGRERAFRFYSEGGEERYRRAVARGDAVPAPEILARWHVGDDVSITEVSGYPIIDADGKVHVHPVVGFVVSGPDGVAHERVYVTDEMFELLAGHMREDFEPL